MISRHRARSYRACPGGPPISRINFVVIDCVQNAFNGHATGIPVTTYVQGFLTEPVNNPPSPTIFLEIVDVIRPGSPPGILHELVQLYR